MKKEEIKEAETQEEKKLSQVKRIALDELDKVSGGATFAGYCRSCKRPKEKCICNKFRPIERPLA